MYNANDRREEDDSVIETMKEHYKKLFRKYIDIEQNQKTQTVQNISDVEMKNTLKQNWRSLSKELIQRADMPQH